MINRQNSIRSVSICVAGSSIASELAREREKERKRTANKLTQCAVKIFSACVSVSEPLWVVFSSFFTNK